MIELIERKQAGLALTQAEIYDMIRAYTKGDIPDYQMSAFLMAVYFQGMTFEEASYLTQAMAESGDQIDLSAIAGVKVDKHSTGGVGDTTTLVLAPLVASLGVPVAKMSGRGLGHTGGTIDKLEAIPGFHTEISTETFVDLVNANQVALMGQTGNLTPADKKLYALRDVTGTVQSIPLIASSIMSKKIAAGADAIVLDVKVGDGAFMKTIEDARTLAETMVQIGEQLNRRTLAVISSMEQPLGFAIGNALEVKEAIATLRGEGPADLTELTLTLGAQMLIASGKVQSMDEGIALLQAQIQNGQAIERFKTFISNQGGDASVVDQPERLAEAAHKLPVKAQKAGKVAAWHAHLVGEAARLVGAGRLVITDEIDPAVGITLERKVGDSVEEGDVLAYLHVNDQDPTRALALLEEAVELSQEATAPPLIIETIH